MNKYAFDLYDNSLVYHATFTTPAFLLWRDRADLVEKVFNLFSPLGAGISDISFRSEGESLDDEVIAVRLEDCEFKLGYSGIVLEAEDVSQKDLSEIFEIIAHANKELSVETFGLKFNQHFVEFGGHGSLVGGNSFEEFLQPHRGPKLKSINQNLPNGMVFNWRDDNAKRKFHLEIDESFDVPGGVFLRYVILYNAERLESADFTESFFVTLLSVLNELNLEWEA